MTLQACFHLFMSDLESEWMVGGGGRGQGQGAGKGVIFSTQLLPLSILLTVTLPLNSKVFLAPVFPFSKNQR